MKARSLGPEAGLLRCGSRDKGLRDKGLSDKGQVWVSALGAGTRPLSHTWLLASQAE